MPLKIIRQDITKIRCDAIVNPTNRRLEPSGGADLAIHEAAGDELYKYCQKLGSCPVGSAKITPAFKLSCKYVIHTAGPDWYKEENPEALLISCYRECLTLAVENKCESIAFPLISSGAYGYPKDKVLKVATRVISDFLFEHELEVYLVVYDKKAYEISSKVFSDVTAFIDDNYIEERCEIVLRDECYIKSAVFASCAAPSNPLKSLDDMISQMDKGFAETLFYYIDKKGMSDVECYKRSNVDKKTFSKIKCNKNYRPSKVTAVSFAIGLRLDIEETNHLLNTVGMSLSQSNLFDVIIKYFIVSGEYETIFDVNEVLYKFDQVMLGV